MSSHADVKHMAMDEFTRAESAAMVIRMQLSQKPHLGVPEIAVVLGSGLGAFAEELKDSVVDSLCRYSEFSALHGRRPCRAAGDWKDRRPHGCAPCRGGFINTRVTAAAKLLFRCACWAGLGVKSLVLTNAAGGINSAYGKGALVVLSDHINLQGNNPLNGPNDERFGPRFPDMTEAYSRSYRRLALDAARELGIDLKEGVYAALRRPEL